MRRVSIGFAAAASMAVVLLGAPSASAQETLAASCEPPPNVTFFSNDPVAQTFTSQVSGSLTRAEVALVVPGGSTAGDFVIQIRTVDSSGTPTQTILATAVFPDESVVENALASVSFPSPATVVAGQQYAIVVSRPDSDQFAVGARFDSSPPDLGEECPHTMRTFSGGTWTDTEINDLVFRIFVTPPAAATCKGQQATHVGTEGADQITGTDDRDVIAALGGNDDVRALGANDLVCGGAGRDSLRGGKNRDKLLGQAGKDTLRGQGGKDRLLGKGGKDKLNGGTGKDVCKGGKKDDTAKKCEVEKSI